MQYICIHLIYLLSLSLGQVRLVSICVLQHYNLMTKFGHTLAESVVQCV